MSEYESKIRNAANLITGMRASGGTTATTLILGLLSVFVSKNKLARSDLEVIFEVEKQGAANTVKDWFSQHYGDPNFELKNEVERDEVIKMCENQVDRLRDFVLSAAADITPPKRTRKKKENSDED